MSAFRWAAALFCGLFLLSVAVQWNDPDPYLWMPLYGLAAWLAARGAAGRLAFVPNALACALYVALFAAWAPTLPGARREAFEHWHMLAPEDEAPREAGGLALCAIWTGAQAWAARRERRTAPGSPRSSDALDRDELPALVELG